MVPINLLNFDLKSLMLVGLKDPRLNFMWCPNYRYGGV